MQRIGGPKVPVANQYMQRACGEEISLKRQLLAFGAHDRPFAGDCGAIAARFAFDVGRFVGRVCDEKRHAKGLARPVNGVKELLEFRAALGADVKRMGDAATQVLFETGVIGTVLSARPLLDAVVQNGLE